MSCGSCALKEAGACGVALPGAEVRRVYLLGPPNSGKSTLFNRLTFSNQTIGNWPGVTVDRKAGCVRLGTVDAEIVDLPGVSSLSSPSAERMDERVTREAILTTKCDLILVAVDLSAPHRGLSMLLQAMDCGLPVLAVLTKADYWDPAVIEAARHRLERSLGIQVLTVSSRRQGDMVEMRKALEMLLLFPPQVSGTPEGAVEESAALVRALEGGDSLLSVNPSAAARRLLERDKLASDLATPDLRALRDRLCDAAEKRDGLVLDAALVEAPLARAGALVATLDMPPPVGRRFWSDRIDRIALSQRWGMLVFLTVMYLVFFVSINLAAVFIDLFDGLAQAAFVDAPALLLFRLGIEGGFLSVALGAVGTGLQTVATFAPVVGFLFFCQILLEESGYMTRAAVVADRMMRRLGLSGRAFLPLILGFGCTIPAILATRALDTRSERIMTALMAPFMSCGARLPVYALFAAAFFPTSGQNIVFVLYLLGVAVALFTGWILAPRLLPVSPRPLAIELPVYQAPAIGQGLRLCWVRLKQFLSEAGRTIAIVVTLLSLLNSFAPDGSIGNEGNGRSILALSARVVTPVLGPMGIEQENWPAAVGLVTGIFAKETVVGTLQALYVSEGESAREAPDPVSTAQGAMRDLAGAGAGLIATLADPLGLDLGPIESFAEAASAQEVEASLFTELRGRFDGAAGAFAYMVLILLYVPCVAALSTICREIGGLWASISALWSTLLAYGGAVMAYQVGTFSQHPQSSSVAIAIFVGLLAGVVVLVRSSVGHAAPERA
ncbi:ferrous iron transport protein B [Shimia aestuarii]|uniref:ferrous iron transport protein B n=1 Tax=Shimia aestuarii TaxID=254406 RepID=UPI001FB5094B|nr:ferrous iron transport protein B [Shimia aestuarii]